MNSYDVAIIGSGPAGAMAAQIIASQGFNVAIIERKKHIGSPIQCGEAITKYALEHVGIPINQSWIKQSVKGVKILLPKEKYFYSTVPGYSIDRQRFDEDLTIQAQKKGATLLLQTMMKTVQRNKGYWTIRTNNKELTSTYLIGADGADSKTARILNLLKQKIYIKGFQYTFHRKDIPFPLSDWLCMHMDETYEGGYGWIFPRNDEVNVGIGSLTGSVHMLHQFCDRFSFDRSKKIRMTGGLVPYHFQMPSRVTDHAVIIGDAAGLTNPVTGGGIHAALYSGKQAGKLVSTCLQQNNPSALKRYDALIEQSLFLHPIHRRTSQYFQQWTNKDWHFLGDAAHGLDMADLSLLKCLKIGINHPRYLLRAKELLTIRKDMKLNQKYGW